MNETFEEIVNNSLWELDESGDDIIMEDFIKKQQFNKFPRIISRFFITEIIPLDEDDINGNQNY
tara:strand:- start:2543 stop:2734 length:192 start_codon:yes stop_codon:yes gene_type:complete